MRFFRHILIAAALPLAALVLAFVFSPSGPPSASAAGDAPKAEICQSAPSPTPAAGDWLDALLQSARDLLS